MGVSLVTNIAGMAEMIIFHLLSMLGVEFITQDKRWQQGRCI
ncbi:hypothetical protein BBC0122_020460 [Bartonella choladocola]|uniref:Uncharacterized protein n=1 Tax=Bartonella choladocola TaxID=2750995 RepID=A0A1U9MK92_9HYPH|nr:hypothetical protein BBC0122_020460 [Bartonella choladocola]